LREVYAVKVYAVMDMIDIGQFVINFISFPIIFSVGFFVGAWWVSRKKPDPVFIALHPLAFSDLKIALEIKNFKQPIDNIDNTVLDLGDVIIKERTPGVD
jgi:hypothetical protein